MSISTVIASSELPPVIKHLHGDEEISESIITTFEQYKYIYKARHDVIHSAICDKLELPWGERAVEIILQGKPQVSTHRFYDDVKKQSPDFFDIKDNTVTMVEVTVSTDAKAKTKKASKYALLCKVLVDSGFQLDYKIFVINPRNVFLNRDELIRNGLDDVVIDFCYKVCTRASELLRRVHMTAEGRTFYQNYFDLQTEIPPIKITSEDVLNTHDTYPRKCFHSDEDLQGILRGPVTPLMTNTDEDFVDKMLEITKKVNSEFLKNKEFDSNEFLGDLAQRSNTRSLRSILPLPYISTKIIDSALRNTEYDLMEVGKVAANMIECSNTIISAIGKSCQRQMMNLEREVLLWIQNIG